jgi:hypothetical protein
MQRLSTHATVAAVTTTRKNHGFIERGESIEVEETVVKEIIQALEWLKIEQFARTKARMV